MGKKGVSLFPSEDHRRGLEQGPAYPLIRESRVDRGIPQEWNMKHLEASTGERSARGRGKGDKPTQEGGPKGSRRKEPVYSHDTG